MSRDPAVSVVIPTYSHRDLIGETLDSVFAQTFRDFEVIVLDDGSTDGTAELLRPLVDERRIRYLRQENSGQAAARNRGLAEARGEFVAFLDDDDLWPREKLDWQVAALRQNPDAVLVYGEERHLHPDGRLTRHILGQPPDGEVYAKFRLRNWITSPGQTLIRTDVLREIGGFDTSLWGADDWDLYIRLARRGPFVFRPDVALHYRIHEGNASRQAIRHALNDMHVVRRHIGWNLPMVFAHQRLASHFFLPKLIAFANRARCEADHAHALAASALALTYRARLLLRRDFLRPVLKDVLVLLGLRRGRPKTPENAAALPARQSEGDK